MKRLTQYLTVTSSLLVSQIACATSTTGQYPWDQPLRAIANDISGPVALSIGIIAIVICGLTMAIGDLQGGAKKALNIIFGLAIAFSAVSLISLLFHSSGTVI